MNRTAAARVLIVEDSESNRYVLSTWLRRAGYEVMEARTGEEGLEIASAGGIELAVLDINLPDLTGYEVCERIKASPLTANVPVLHVSATAVQPSDRSQGLRRGAEGYLVEPVEREELLATVEALLRAAAAQRTVRRLAHRLRRLNEATLSLNDARTLEELVLAVAEQAAVLFESWAVAAIVLDGRPLLSIAGQDHPARLQPCSVADVEDLERAAAASDGVREATSWSGVPSPLGTYLAESLGVPGGQNGVLLVDVPADWRTSGDETATVLSQYARASAIAIRNLRSYAIERRIALMLQENLLPDATPSIPGMEVVARYAASAEHAEVGGDFYEVFSLGDGRVIVAIGDVVGHSLEAATIMAQLRTGIRCYALEGHPPSAVLERLNRLLLEFHQGETATVCCVVCDTTTGACELANAGHLPPLLRSGKTSRFLPPGGTLLGIAAPSPPTQRFSMAAGDVLLLYTDGLVGRRSEPIDAGLERLAAAVVAEQGALEELSERMMREVAPKDILDDVAFVALRRRPG